MLVFSRSAVEWSSVKGQERRGRWNLGELGFLAGSGRPFFSAANHPADQNACRRGQRECQEYRNGQPDDRKDPDPNKSECHRVSS